MRGRAAPVIQFSKPGIPLVTQPSEPARHRKGRKWGEAPPGPPNLVFPFQTTPSNQSSIVFIFPKNFLVPGKEVTAG